MELDEYDDRMQPDDWDHLRSDTVNKWRIRRYRLSELRKAKMRRRRLQCQS